MEKDIIKQYLEKKKALEVAEEILENHFKALVEEQLKTAITSEDFNAIREGLRIMPLCASKVLLFRTIILTEESREA